MLQEMKLEDALKKFLQGRKVLVMYDEALEADKPAFTVEPLEEMLKELKNVDERLNLIRAQRFAKLEEKKQQKMY